ncbi:MAG: hypothetical protein GEU79_03970, partial [Acidimicrobiia bacterium]|nr:hypothetical protein [Acidimicrobiia bacterium]
MSRPIPRLAPVTRAVCPSRSIFRLTRCSSVWVRWSSHNYLNAKLPDEPLMTVDTSSLRVAVDIGGTFTDLVLVEDERVIRTGKVLTTPDDPSQAVAEGIYELLGDLDYVSVAEIVHGTTLVSNALIERKGAVTALITTEGFRDVLESGKEQRYDLYDLFLEMPPPLVPRRRRMGLRERVLADGSIDTLLDVDDVRGLVGDLDPDVTAVAVCLLH